MPIRSLENIIQLNSRDSVIVRTVRPRTFKEFLLREIRYYQTNISPKIKEKLGRKKLCKFEPSCSEYARQAIEKYDAFNGGLMGAYRLLRCNPWNKGGYDPVK